MFKISYSELTIRIILAIGFLMVGILYVENKKTGLPNTGSTSIDPSPAVMALVSQKESNSAIHATDPQKFSAVTGQLQVVEFYAPGDPLSEDSAQLMQTFENRYRGEVIFSFLDVLDPRNKTSLYQLNDLFYPQFDLLDGSGRILDQWTSVSDEKLYSAIVKARLVEPLW